MKLRKQFWQREVAYSAMSPMVKFGDDHGSVEVNGAGYNCTYRNNDGVLASRGCASSEEAVVWLVRQEKLSTENMKGSMYYGVPQIQRQLAL